MNVTADLLRTLNVTRAQFDARCESIAALLERSDKAVEAAIVRIYDRQTRDEKAAEETKHDNGIGFQACDARRGTYWARLILSGRHLFADRMPKARRMTIKYRRQLAVLSFLKDMAKTMPKGSKTPIAIERALRDGLEVVTAGSGAITSVTMRNEIGMDFSEPTNCERCGLVTCPDGCCCGC